MIRAVWNLWVLLCGFQSRAFPVYIRACEILWVRASVTGSVGGVVDTQPILWGAREDVCVGNVLNGYGRLSGVQNCPLTWGRLVSFHMRTNTQIGKSIWLWSCRMWGLSWISVNMADTRSDGPEMPRPRSNQVVYMWLWRRAASPSSQWDGCGAQVRRGLLLRKQSRKRSKAGMWFVSRWTGVWWPLRDSTQVGTDEAEKG